VGRFAPDARFARYKIRFADARSARLATPFGRGGTRFARDKNYAFLNRCAVQVLVFRSLRERPYRLASLGKRTLKVRLGLFGTVPK